MLPGCWAESAELQDWRVWIGARFCERMMRGGEHMVETILETDRLILRTWDDADIDPFMTHLNTPAVMRWLGPLRTRADMEKTVARVAACQTEHGHCFWLLERKADGALLGFCGIKRVDAAGTDLTGEFEVGWRAARRRLHRSGQHRILGADGETGHGPP
jgi:RimJ/RimL family protein N-acetyltransferase